MLLGTNITSAKSFECARAFTSLGLIDFYELLLDNFLHLEPALVRAELGATPVAFHIMASRFLTQDEERLAETARLLRRWTEELQPLYVSDHLLVAEAAGRLLPESVEPRYTDPKVVAAAGRWQRSLSCPLLLENFPSLSAAGCGQVELFEQLQDQYGIRPLFDFSNAVIAELNGADRADRWLTAGVQVTACHISGYRHSSVVRDILIDSHDRAVSEQSWELLRDFAASGRTPETLVIERDGHIDRDSWQADLVLAQQLRTAAARSPRVAVVS